MLVVSLRGVNCRFWSCLGCSGQNTIIFSRKGLFKGCTRRNIKKLYIFNLFYLLQSCDQSLNDRFQGLGHTQTGLLQRFNSKFLTSILTPSIWAWESPRIASKLLAYFAWPFIYMYYVQALLLQISILLFKQDNMSIKYILISISLLLLASVTETWFRSMLDSISWCVDTK